MNKFTTFYIVRHALSEANRAGVISGHTETKLSLEGIKQARSRAKDLKNVHFDAAFASTLERAHHTAKIIAKEHGLSVVALDILKERNYGAAEGKRHDDLEDSLREQLDTYNSLEYPTRYSLKLVPGMESDEEVIARFTNFLKKTAHKYPGKTILVVSHGNMIRTFLVHLGLGTLKELTHEATQNTCYFVLKTDGETFTVEKTVGIEKKQA